ncbi:MAG: hypothetical protein IKS34_01220, partial [Clostridia bacterium]|nr:hypothetical protein [Clostridia bacterium]
MNLLELFVRSMTTDASVEAVSRKSGASGAQSALLINLAIAGMAIYFILRTIRRARERAAMQDPPPKHSNAKWIFMNPLIYICILIYVSLLILYYAV